MSTLGVCREFEKIEVIDGVASVVLQNGRQLELTEKIKTEMDLFFKSKGLSFKINEQNKNVDPTETLRNLFGNKLKIK